MKASFVCHLKVKRHICYQLVEPMFNFIIQLIIEASKRKRGRQSAGSVPPAPPARKTSSRIASNNERQTRKSASTPEADSTRSSSRKRGRPTSYYPSSLDDLDAKRKREKSPTSSAENEDEIKPETTGTIDSDIDEAGELKIDQHGNLLEGKIDSRSNQLKKKADFV